MIGAIVKTIFDLGVVFGIVAIVGIIAVVFIVVYAIKKVFKDPWL